MNQSICHTGSDPRGPQVVNGIGQHLYDLQLDPPIGQHVYDLQLDPPLGLVSMERESVTVRGTGRDWERERVLL